MKTSECGRALRFMRLYVQSAAWGAGGAIGAAMVVWHRLNKGNPSPWPSPLVRGEGEDQRGEGVLRSSPHRFVMDHAYWGPAFSNEEIGTVLEAAQARIGEQGCAVERMDDEGELREAVPQ